MSRQSISLKSRVRFDGRVRTFDRRATRGADLEKLPDPLWYTVGQVLRTKFRKAASVVASAAPKPTGPTSTAARGK